MSENNDQKNSTLSNVQGQMRLSERIAASFQVSTATKKKKYVVKATG